MTGRFTAAALVAAAVSLLLVAPYLLGLHAERLYRQTLERLAERGYRVEEGHYSRGWLVSDAAVVIAPPAFPAPLSEPDSGPTSGPTRLKLTNRITHGPRSGEWRQWPPVLAAIRSRISVIGGPRQLPPLLVDGVLVADGAIAAALRMPNLAYSGVAGRLNWVDGRGSLRTDADMTAWHVEGELRRLEAVDSDARALVLEHLRWRLDLADADGGLPIGDASLSLDRLRLDGGGRLPPIAAAGLRLGLRTVIAGEHAGLSAELGIDELSMDRAAFAPSGLRLSLTRLDVHALARLLDDVTALNASDLPASLRGLVIGALVTQSFPALLAAAPRIALEELTLMTPKGPVRAKGFVELRDGEPTDVRQPLLWLRRLSGDAQISAPRTLILQLLADEQQRRVRQELRHLGVPDEPLPPRLDAEVSAAASAALAALIRDGWLLAEGDRLRAAAALGDGQLALNGKILQVAGWSPP